MPGPVAAFLSGWAGGIWFPVSLGRWRFLVLACWFSGVAWLVALTTRSSGRVRVTPSRRRVLKPWARLPTTVAAARCRVTFFDGVRAGTAKSIMLTAKRFAAPLQYQ